MALSKTLSGLTNISYGAYEKRDLIVTGVLMSMIDSDQNDKITSLHDMRKYGLNLSTIELHPRKHANAQSN